MPFHPPTSTVIPDNIAALMRRHAISQDSKIKAEEAKRVKRLAHAASNIDLMGTSPVVQRQVISYAGSDILCLITIPARHDEVTNDPGFSEIEEKIQTLTVSSARSVMPVRRLGETNPVAYARGSRTIAGSMVFTAGLRDAFINMLSKSYTDGEPIKEPTLFVDQIPKFSMVLQASNELGGVSSAILLNITLTNFGTTFSIDDIYTESTYTYVAEQYFPLAATSWENDKEVLRKNIMKLYALASDASSDLGELISGYKQFAQRRQTRTGVRPPRELWPVIGTPQALSYYSTLPRELWPVIGTPQAFRELWPVIGTPQ